MAGQQPSADTALRSSLVVLGAIAYSVAALAYRFRRHRDVYSGFTHVSIILGHAVYTCALFFVDSRQFCMGLYVVSCHGC